MKLRSLLLMLVLAPTTWAGSAAYVNVNQENAPYRWKLANGTLLSQGLSNKQGQVPLLEKKGETRYVLEMMYGEFKMEIPRKCWAAANNEAFASCIKISPREDSASQKAEAKELAQKDQEFSDARNASTAWVAKTLDEKQQQRILEQALAEHNQLIPSFGDLSKVSFSCKKLALAAPSAQASAAFDEASRLPSGTAQTTAYAKAAELGSWRAAARLASNALESEIWEDAKPSIAWLLNQKIPAGYNKLADLLTTVGSYDGERLSTQDQILVTTLRLRAAQQGDPLSQITLAHYFEKKGQSGVAKSLKDCAQQQNPDLK